MFGLARPIGESLREMRQASLRNLGVGLLLIAGAFGNVVVSTAAGLKAAPMAWLFMTIGGILAGQMIYRWRKDIILTTVVCVVIALYVFLV